MVHSSIAKHTDSIGPAEKIFGESITVLLRELKLSTISEEKFLAIERWLDKQLNPDDFYLEVIRYAIEGIENSPTQINLSKLYEELG